jgi:hypothetical protein
MYSLVVTRLATVHTSFIGLAMVNGMFVTTLAIVYNLSITNVEKHYALQPPL